MTPVQQSSRRLSPATRARMNVNRLKATLPRFDDAGILDQVANTAYDGWCIVDADVARALGSDLFWQHKARYEQRHYATSVALRATVLGPENRAALEADAVERWSRHRSMLQMVERSSSLKR